MRSWTELSLSLAGLRPEKQSWPEPRAAIEWVAANGFRFIQLDAAMPGLRPRDLDRSARRGVGSLLRKLELSVTGIDLWIPQEHFTRPDQQQRALDAVEAAIELGTDLRTAMMTLSVRLPVETGTWRDHLASVAHRAGIPIADHAENGPGAGDATAIGIGVDPASALSAGLDPVMLVSRAGTGLLSARLSDAGTVRRVAAGRGRLDLMAYAAAMATAGFARPVVADVREVESPLEAATAARAAWPPI